MRHNRHPWKDSAAVVPAIKDVMDRPTFGGDAVLGIRLLYLKHILQKRWMSFFLSLGIRLLYLKHILLPGKGGCHLFLPHLFLPSLFLPQRWSPGLFFGRHNGSRWKKTAK